MIDAVEAAGIDLTKTGPEADLKDLLVQKLT